MSTSPAALTATEPNPTPWWATPVFHFLTGFAVLATGFALLHFGQIAEGDAAIGSGLTFLGVGVGASGALRTP